MMITPIDEIDCQKSTFQKYAPDDTLVEQSVGLLDVFLSDRVCTVEPGEGLAQPQH